MTVQKPYVFTEEDRVAVKEYLARPQIIVPPSRDKSVSTYSAKSDIFSPHNFDDYIGQSEAKDLASIMVRAANNERRPLPNIMLVGEYGLGKTSLANVIMRAAGLPERKYAGASINKELPENGTFIIDEIHNLESNVADTLNTYLDDGRYHIIGCTTHLGQLSSAFRSRFRTLQLKPYTASELATILQRICSRRGTTYAKGSTEGIAVRSRFNARQSIMYLSTVFDIMSVSNKGILTKEVVSETFSKLGVDDKGLLPRDRQYIQALPKDRPVGLQYLAAVLGIDETTIEEEVEPFLLRMGFIDRTPRGRIKIEG